MSREAEFSQGENEIKDAPEGQKELHDYIKQNKEVIMENWVFSRKYDYGEGVAYEETSLDTVGLAGRVWWGTAEKGKDSAAIKLHFFDSQSNLAEANLDPSRIPGGEKLANEKKISLTPPPEEKKRRFWLTSARGKWVKQWQEILQPIISSKEAQFPGSRQEHQSTRDVEIYFSAYQDFLRKEKKSA